MAFTNEVQAALDRSPITVIYVSGSVKKWWNANRRDKNTIALGAGFYWYCKGVERGPFGNRTAALRDAYYRIIEKTEPPLIDMREIGMAGKPRRKHHQRVTLRAA